MSHYRKVCEIHGNVVSQCRHPGTFNRLTGDFNKVTYKVACEGVSCSGQPKAYLVGRHFHFPRQADLPNTDLMACGARFIPPDSLVKLAIAVDADLRCRRRACANLYDSLEES